MESSKYVPYFTSFLKLLKGVVSQTEHITFLAVLGPTLMRLNLLEENIRHMCVTQKSKHVIK